jgi:hypothetical protein
MVPGRSGYPLQTRGFSCVGIVLRSSAFTVKSGGLGTQWVPGRLRIRAGRRAAARPPHRDEAGRSGRAAPAGGRARGAAPLDRRPHRPRRRTRRRRALPAARGGRAGVRLLVARGPRAQGAARRARPPGVRRSRRRPPRGSRGGRGAIAPVADPGAGGGGRGWPSPPGVTRARLAPSCRSARVQLSLRSASQPESQAVAVGRSGTPSCTQSGSPG